MWTPASDAPEGEVVMTKIDDVNGCRNEAALYRQGRLWWTADGAMYVYYTPTHFRLLTDDEKNRERNKIKREADAHARAVERIV